MTIKLFPPNTAQIINSDNLWKKTSPKSLLLDTDSILSIMEYKGDNIMLYFSEEQINSYIIHPVLIELLKTDNAEKRTTRLKFLSKYNIGTLPLKKEELDHAREIQNWLVENRYFKASIVDLYLAGTLIKYNKSGLYLLTGNVSDFPSPLFKRHANIILENNNSGKILYFLNLTEKELNANYLI